MLSNIDSLLLSALLLPDKGPIIPNPAMLKDV